jgi:hypothetical protein
MEEGMRVVNDERGSRTNDDPTALCELVDEWIAENEDPESGPDLDDWIPEEEGYGYGV